MAHKTELTQNGGKSRLWLIERHFHASRFTFFLSVSFDQNNPLTPFVKGESFGKGEFLVGKGFERENL